MANEELHPDSYFVLEQGHEMDPSPILAACLRMPEHEHIRDVEPIIGVIFRDQPLEIGGKVVIGSVQKPEVTGRLRDMFEWMLLRVLGYVPDYLITLDWQYWHSASPHEREILVFHELCHIVHKRSRATGELMFDQETGLPKLGIGAHDLEEFNAVVARYGAHSEDIRAFLAAVKTPGLGRAETGQSRAESNKVF